MRRWTIRLPPPEREKIRYLAPPPHGEDLPAHEAALELLHRRPGDQVPPADANSNDGAADEDSSQAARDSFHLRQLRHR